MGNEEGIKTFWDKGKLKEFMPSKPFLKECQSSPIHWSIGLTRFLSKSKYKYRHCRHRQEFSIIPM